MLYTVLITILLVGFLNINTQGDLRQSETPINVEVDPETAARVREEKKHQERID